MRNTAASVGSRKRARPLNAIVVTGTGALALVLWTRGKVEVGTVAMALPLAWQIVNIAGWVAWQTTSIFENVGVIQEGMMTIARPITLTDPLESASLRLIVRERGRIIEQGTHAELLRSGGHYAALWRRQSLGFIAAGLQAAE